MQTATAAHQRIPCLRQCAMRSAMMIVTLAVMHSSTQPTTVLTVASTLFLSRAFAFAPRAHSELASIYHTNIVEKGQHAPFSTARPCVICVCALKQALLMCWLTGNPVNAILQAHGTNMHISNNPPC